jgi:hypothetical protein
MKNVVRHMIIPASMPVIFFLIAMTPVEVFGCRTRGLIALLIALISGLAALGTAIKGAKGRMQGDTYAIWWVTSSIILVIPVIALIIMA